MTNKPDLDLLSELFNSEEWKALKTEIETCRDNALVRLKKEGEVNREYQAGAVFAYETVLGFEYRYKNTPLKVDDGKN